MLVLVRILRRLNESVFILLRHLILGLAIGAKLDLGVFLNCP